MVLENQEVLGYDVYSGTLNQVPWSDLNKFTINTINQYSYCVAKEDIDFNHALKASNILLPDGIGIVWAAKLTKNTKIQKIAGADIHEFLLGYLQEFGGSCFYMGSSENVLSKIKERLRNEYPNVKVGSYSPPFKKEFSAEDDNKIIDAINSFSPDVIFVGMTAPKQEKWVIKNEEAIERGIICTIGAVFDFYAGTVNRPNKTWQKLGLEWFGRLVKEPKRMWKRYIYYGVVFTYHLIANFKNKS